MKTFIIPIFCFFTFGLTAQIPSYVPTNGLVGWWPFNGNANDESGNGNHGTVNGATLTSDRNGKPNKAFNLNAIGSKIDLLSTNSYLGTSNHTISYWFKTQYNGNDQYILSKRPTCLGGDEQFMEFKVSANSNSINLGFTFNHVSPVNPFSPAQWNIITFVRDVNNYFIYINGVLTDSGNYSMNIEPNAILGISSSSACIAFGQNNKRYIGDIDDICIWNRALNQGEINTLYTTTPNCINPTALISSQGNTTFCQGENVKLNANTGANFTYQWYKDNQLINGVTSSSYQVTLSGNYTVKVSDGACNATSSAISTILIDTLTWTGNVDNDWHKPCNWSPEIVPLCCANVKIPLTTNQPIVSQLAFAKTISVYSTLGANIKVKDGAKLFIESCLGEKTINNCLVGIIQSLDCSNISNNGNLTAGISASEVNSIIPYSGGNGGYFNKQTINSTGVHGLTATIPAGSFVNGEGTLNFTISGIPSSVGTASFEINIGSKLCVFNRTVSEGSFQSLNCLQVNNVGSLTIGVVASAVNSFIPYTGGNGGLFSKQTINSTGVLGLSATLQAGSYVLGDGTLNFVISGTPTSIGIASFEINIGGKLCILKRTVSQPSSGYGTNISDIDGNSYKTVYIGTQQWMAENLKTAKYNDGTFIPNITDNIQWSNLTTGAWAYYNNDASNNTLYGKLYNWYALNSQTNGNKNVCPVGWHVPYDYEWTILSDYLGGENIAGGKMKQIGLSNWKSPNTDATNSFLFNAVPGGIRRNQYYGFSYIGISANWWSLSRYFNSNFQAWYFQILNSSSSLIKTTQNNLAGLSIRCIKD
jgi:uncharacterized protein (TIGR02145 family)